MTGTIELSDQDIRDLIAAIDWYQPYVMGDEGQDRFDALKARLLQVNVNEF